MRYLLCAIDLFSKSVWATSIKGKNEITVVDCKFKSILDNSKRKPNNIWVVQGSEFYNSLFKKWSKDDSIKMYSTCNDGEFVVVERIIKTLKTRFLSI